LFRGTDNLNTLEWINYFYPGDNGFIGGSVSATEHSTMTSFGKDHEFDAYEYLIDTNPEGILSVVSDTYNLWTVITDFLPRLHEKIMARNGKLVIRPDSGDPTDILAGTVHELGMGDTPEEKGLIELLWDEFGGVVNDKGFKTLDQHIGAIYGDSINLERAEDIFTRLANKGFASDNIVYGAGSYFAIGQTTRDSLSSAVKATWVQINGEGHDIFKDPITAGGSKKSATGRLAVLKDTDGELYLVQHATPEQEAVSELQTVWKDGKWVRKQSYADVRETLRKNIEQHW
jgi:nicotinamide phosphoribosyltransferase